MIRPLQGIHCKAPEILAVRPNSIGIHAHSSSKVRATVHTGDLAHRCKIHRIPTLLRSAHFLVAAGAQPSQCQLPHTLQCRRILSRNGPMGTRLPNRAIRKQSSFRIGFAQQSPQSRAQTRPKRPVTHTQCPRHKLRSIRRSRLRMFRGKLQRVVAPRPTPTHRESLVRQILVGSVGIQDVDSSGWPIFLDRPSQLRSHKPLDHPGLSRIPDALNHDVRHTQPPLHRCSTALRRAMRHVCSHTV